MNTVYPWKVFLQVAEDRSFRQAALALRVSPSAVSHVILKLEEETGFFLFVRSRGGVQLTANGRLLVPYARSLVGCCDALDQQLMGLRNVCAGEVRIGGFNSACAMWMPDILRRFSAQYPQVEVTVYQQGDRTVRRMVENGEVDLAFLSEDIAGDCDFLPLHRTPLVCLAPRDFTPANGRYVTAEDLRDAVIILQADGYDTEIQRYLHMSSLPGKALYRLEVDATCHAYVEQGLGLCITPEMTFRCSPRDVGVWPIRPAISRTVGLATVFPDFITPAAREMRRHILAYMAEQGLRNV